ncbi:MAG: hypothetical protein M3Z10_03130, partial [Gemmatimonadota bacterium]|nr:hypothetical protein [Gemmatimonadota bacterium]
MLVLPLQLLACRETGSARHPLDPLDAGEMRTARAVLRDAGLLTADRRVMLLDLNEPRKADVLGGIRTPREAFAVLYDARRNVTGEAVLDVDARVLRGWHEVQGVQPALDGVDGALAESLTRASTEWRAAVARRGTTPDAVAVFTWSAGDFGDDDPARGRRVRTLTYMRAAGDNEIARPVEGLVVLVDLTARRVVHVDDTPTVPVPDAASERDAWRPLPPPVTPDGPTASWSNAAWAGAAPRVDAHGVSWRRWRFRVALRPREGLVLYAVGFDDGTRVRSVMYRGALSEMVVPYGDPGAGWYFRNSFDVGELGMGTVATSLVSGVDCPRDAALLDATMADGN